MTVEECYKRAGVTNQEDYQKEIDRRFQAAKALNRKHGNKWFDDAKIQTMADFRKWYKENFKGIPVGVCLAKIPKDLLVPPPEPGQL